MIGDLPGLQVGARLENAPITYSNSFCSVRYREPICRDPWNPERTDIVNDRADQAGGLPAYQAAPFFATLPPRNPPLLSRKSHGWTSQIR